jgi:LysM repeat protein
MNRIGLTALACVLVAVPITISACGDGSDSASDTLPPMATTTTSTVLITTTTTWVPIQYEILPGDGLGDIAAKFGVDIEKLALLNGITNKDDIEAGDILDIPPPTVPATTVAPATT